MKKFKVTVPYWYTLSATVEAETKEEALKKFDDIPTDECRESYQGLLGTEETSIEEVN